jgi:hypothetical protein
MRRKQVDVDPPQARAHQTVRVDELEGVFAGHVSQLRKGTQQGEDFDTPPQVPAGEFPDDEWVAQRLSVEEQVLQSGIRSPEVVHPHRGINQRHRDR